MSAKKGLKKGAVSQTRDIPAGGGDLFSTLPLRQRNFIVNYLGNGFNATKAAKDAGFSPKSAESQASRLLRNDKVKAILSERSKKAIEKQEITADRVLEEIGKLAFFDPRKLFTAGGNLLDIGELGDDEAASIAGLEISEIFDGKGKDRVQIGHLKKIKISDKAKSLEMLGRYFKLFTERVEHTGTLGVQLVTSVPRPEREKK